MLGDRGLSVDSSFRFGAAGFSGTTRIVVRRVQVCIYTYLHPVGALSVTAPWGGNHRGVRSFIYPFQELIR